jgi:FeS assembly SUF system protein
VSEPATQQGATHEAWSPDGPIAPTRVSEVAVLDALKSVYDPEIPVDIYELGLIYAVEIEDDGAVKIDMTLTAPSCPSAQELPVQVEQAVKAVPNVTSVKVEVVWDPPWDQSRMSEDAKLALNVY